MDHVDKDSRPDLLEGINVKMEPGREQGRSQGREKRTKRRGATRRRSHFDLFVNGRREVELSEGLPLLRSADAVVGQLLHGHPVDAFRVPDPVVHLRRAKTVSGSKVRTRAIKTKSNVQFYSASWSVGSESSITLHYYQFI